MRTKGYKCYNVKCGSCMGKTFCGESEDAALGCANRMVNAQTNADRIRAMSDEELAVWLCGITDCSLESCPGAHLCTGGGGRANGIVEWLKQPYKEENQS